MIYPSTPTHIDSQKLQPSAAFRKQVVVVLFSILAFFIVYIGLMLAAIALAAGCVFTAGFVVMAHPSFITLSIGLGLLALGVSVLFFLIKFIFKVSKNVNPSRIQITKEEQPELFAFIRRINEETGTPFPKKIFLSPDVNASVFYNSSFWSMLLPVRKNLEIGIGLVNSVNISEFKAILAHEFGHFSQRSMKLGSFTYNVNQIIFNMLYDNSSYGEFLSGWARIGSVVSLFAIATGKIATAIQSILKAMYKVVNKSYLGLSREMEFHADAVAASVSGGNNLITALARIEVASGCYQTALNKAGEWLKENRVSKNLFGNQLIVYQGVADEYRLPLSNGLPAISSSFMEHFSSSSNINYKDQWASHPSFADRKQRAEALGMDVAPEESSAWVLFSHATELQEQMTERLYEPAPYDRSAAKLYDNVYFDDWYSNERSHYQLPAAYNGFYDKRYIAMENWDLDALSKPSTDTDFEQVFSAEHTKLPTAIQSCQKDMAIVEAIKDRRIDVRSFDFMGTKYSLKNADAVIDQLKAEVKRLEDTLLLVDQEAYRFFYASAGTHQQVIKEGYLQLQRQSIHNKAFGDSCQRIYDKIAPLYQSGNTVEFVHQSIASLKLNHEPALKKDIQQMLDETALAKSMDDDQRMRLDMFVKSNFSYYSDNSFRNNELEDLNYIIDLANTVLNNKKFSLYKQVLSEQLQAIGKAA